MIQRIQSIYLLVAFLLLTIQGVLSIQSLCNPENEGLAQVFASPYGVWGYVFIALTLLGAALSFVDIFFYRDRMKQVRTITVVQLLTIAAYICFAIPVLRNSALNFETVTIPVLPALSLLGCIMARKAILKDEKLVRSADRIR